MIQPPDIVRVFLKDVKLLLPVGVYEAEHDRPQAVTAHIDIEAEALSSYDGLDDNDLDKVINYDLLYNFLQQDLPRFGHIALLETVAEHIAGFCLRDPRVMSVGVRLDKTEIYPDATVAGVELRRLRPG